MRKKALLDDIKSEFSPGFDIGVYGSASIRDIEYAEWSRKTARQNPVWQDFLNDVYINNVEKLVENMKD